MEELIQTLIRELQEYIQKVAGEEGYIDPSEIWIPVDHASFGGNARKYRLSSIIGTSAKVPLRGNLLKPEEINTPSLTKTHPTFRLGSLLSSLMSSA